MYSYSSIGYGKNYQRNEITCDKQEVIVPETNICYTVIFQECNLQLPIENSWQSGDFRVARCLTGEFSIPVKVMRREIGISARGSTKKGEEPNQNDGSY